MRHVSNLLILQWDKGIFDTQLLWPLHRRITSQFPYTRGTAILRRECAVSFFWRWALLQGNFVSCALLKILTFFIILTDCSVGNERGPCLLNVDAYSADVVVSAYFGFILSFDRLSPHTRHKGWGSLESPVHENPIFKYSSLYWRTTFCFFLEGSISGTTSLHHFKYFSMVCE